MRPFMKYLKFSLFILPLLLLACEDDDMPEPPATINFDGIHLTDENGQAIGGGDATDWKLEDTWDERILTFFNQEERNLCGDASEYQAFSAYPNPATTQIALAYVLKDSADLEVRIVDRNYRLLREVDAKNVFAPGFNTSFVRLDDLNITDTVRFYYKIIGKNCELRGHGDVIIAE